MVLSGSDLSNLMGNIRLSDEGKEALVYLTDGLKSRFAGSEGEKLAANFIKKKFGEYGLKNLSKEEFTIQGWQRGSTDFTIFSAPDNKFSAIALPYCPSSEIEGGLIDLKDGLKKDFDRNIKGKIVLVSSRTPSYRDGTLSRGEKYEEAVKGGAKGFVFIDHNPGNLAQTGSLKTNEIGEIPGIGISKETGEKIKRKLKGKENLRAEIKVKVKTEKAKSCNVIGEINPGADPGAEEVILLGGHLDAHDISRGALDNGAGIATVLQIASSLTAYESNLEKTVRFAAFGAEEVGLLGSKNYVRENGADDVDFMLNFDGPGIARDLKINTNGFSRTKSWITEFYQDKDSPVIVENKVRPDSDHWPFVTRGIPVGQLLPNSAEKGRGWAHTSADTLDKIDFRNIKENAAVLTRLILFLQTKNLSSLRKSPGEIERICEEENVKYEIDWLKN